MIWQRLKDWVRGVPLGGIARNSNWNKFVKDLIIVRGNKCEITGGAKKLIGHHIIPFHKRPDLEMVKENIIIVSEKVFGSNIHLAMCHLGNFKSWNPNIEEDAKMWLEKITNRP